MTLKDSPHPAPHSKGPFEEAPVDVFQRRAFLILLALISVGFLYVVRYFLLTLFMAAVFTGLSYPLYQFMLRHLRRPAVASAATLLTLILLLILPIAAVIMVAYQQAFVFFQTFDFQSLPGSMDEISQQIQQRWPVVFHQFHITRQDLTQYATAGGQHAAEWLLHQGATWSLVAVSGLVNFMLMLFIMFYFYIDGERILKRIYRWSPLPDDYETAIFKKFLVVGRGTLKGIFIIGAIQGGLCSLLFWATGVGSPIFLGVLTIFASIIPAFGAGLIWFPVAVILLISGKFGAALTVTLVGGLVISTVDNILRPAVVGKDIEMHDVMVLVSTLGGLAVFGLPGFIIGPILAALFLSCWTIFEKMFSLELARTHDKVKMPKDL
jgi:predicted PurR-regulated permease PerM